MGFRALGVGGLGSKGFFWIFDSGISGFQYLGFKDLCRVCGTVLRGGYGIQILQGFSASTLADFEFRAEGFGIRIWDYGMSYLGFGVFGKRLFDADNGDYRYSPTSPHP